MCLMLNYQQEPGCRSDPGTKLIIEDCKPLPRDKDFIFQVIPELVAELCIVSDRWNSLISFEVPVVEIEVLVID